MLHAVVTPYCCKIKGEKKYSFQAHLNLAKQSQYGEFHAELKDSLKDLYRFLSEKRGQWENVQIRSDAPELLKNFIDESVVKEVKALEQVEIDQVSLVIYLLL